MKRPLVLILLAIAFQVLVLLYMAGQREFILLTGQTVYLRTAPLDPRDLFRGDFVRLDYSLSNIGLRQLGVMPELAELNKGDRIYAMLTRDARGIADPVGYSIEQPDQGLFLRGRIIWANTQSVQVKYGIETYFVEQGQGRDIEDRRGSRTTLQVPLEMELALDGSGTAIIKGHRWSPLGIRLEIVPDPNAGPDTEPVNVTVKLTLQNASEQPLALVDLPNFCSLALESVARWSQKDWRLAADPCEEVQASDTDVIVLQPQENHVFELALADPRWYVVAEDTEPTPLTRIPGERFRLIYQPPNPEASAHLNHKDLIWHGRLPAAAFTGRGRVD